MKGYNTNKGFSLIELIVVIAILSVFTIMLAPKLLFYTERSRAEKDNSSMDEVVNAIQLALADQKVYDEVLRFSTVDNISCYVDTNSEDNYQKVITKSNHDGIDQYTFTSDARLLDETPFFAAGNMRGVTITFAPNKDSNESTYDLKQGVINQYIQISDNQRVGAMPELYNRLRSSVGDTIAGDSQTYRNSEYTIFIRLGTMGGNDESAQDAVSVYGQWSGTNLPQQVSYQLVTDRITGDDGKQIVEIDDNKWNEDNGSKLTVNPGDLNGGGSFDPTTDTGNKQYTADDFQEHEKGIYAYLSDNKELIIRNTPREDTNGIQKDYGNLGTLNYRNWDDCAGIVEVVIFETPILPTSCSGWFSGFSNLTEFKNIKNLILDNCANTGYMFQGCSSLKSLNLSNKNIKNVKTMIYMFSDCKQLGDLNLKNWDPQQVERIDYMFYNCASLKSIDCSNWSNMKTLIGMERTFDGCKSVEKININNWNTEKLKYVGNAFSNCEKLSTLEIEKIETGNVVSMNSMFSGCKSLTSLDLSEWDTKNVSSFDGMFWGCDNIQEINMGNLNTEKLTSTNIMFRGCKNLKTVNLDGWNTTNIKNMNWMFYGCSSLENLNLDSFDVSNVETAESLFSGCGSLKELNIAHWKFEKCKIFSGMFQGCSSLKRIDVSNFDISNATNIGTMFYWCLELESIGDISKINNWNVDEMEKREMFYRCTKLSTIPSWYEGPI